ncbi:membrane protein insertase YidC [Wohlfahrtiimonas chitiniclastica]|uniref:membrane protein insertase YidC n=1 Tax=Wohlfahrtiimonas chitiniclastica TaxID=400946 RepID=UPI000B992E91|nr:membrane protein insertase YidC [Wohlfahrtiimonas chitiniclastica]MBS7815260.1 membrane protein insertase YidC [Wohlfahrtiimonas chitiniclastica]MBS7817308.1 membrane protein insertase YidC [Wohlfahrtiimonas chitiniclastica]MBS7820923.1 membrane protein insertase YidC [Wohlfahrtiimonas chitiniclastica]MBS7823118.1 membrane protein insertase YidC [Wohlfahrtiimonas chitiniclastica]MBS7828083.1 membrane protein insertase YidC [Wohlfahrtiimonas chitiniclastica]
MQNNRLILWGIFGLLAFMLFSKWQFANAPKPPEAQSAQVVTQMLDGQATDGSVPQLNSANVPDGMMTNSKKISVTTDVFSINIALTGADIEDVKLLKYSESLEQKDVPFALLSSDPKRRFVSQTGLISTSGQASFPHSTEFSAQADSYTLEEGQDTLIVPLTYTDANGIVVTKTYEFKRGSYDIGFTQKIDNNTDNAWQGINYMQLLQKDPKASGHLMGASSYTGPVFSMGEESYKKVPFDKLIEKAPAIKQEGTAGWGAMIQQYFTSAWLALNTHAHVVEVAKLPGDMAMIRLMSKDPVVVPAHASYEFKNSLYSGPKIKKNLVDAGEYTYVNDKGQEEKANAKLELTLDYGWFSPISALMLWVLEFFHGIVGNWGWAIVLLTLTAKLILYPLSEKGYRSMAKMRHLAPEMQRIKELYGSDKQKIGQETIALYRKEKVNPMGGCWPMLIQIPIFISLFWMLQESVQLRQAPWILWIHDLAIMDPYFILPIIMCATMFVQQMFNPPPPDPMQAKIMKFMPLVFGFMFMWFAAGIVLYWIVNNLLTILQQWLINRRIEAAQKKMS